MISTRTLLVVAAAALAAVAYVSARPHKEFVLADIVNKTICPIKVHIDDDPERVPRRIKFLRCADTPSKLCAEHAAHGCCRRRHHDYFTECVEMYDYVQVQYRGSDAPDVIRVPVGCTCLIEETTRATEPQ